MRRRGLGVIAAVASAFVVGSAIGPSVTVAFAEPCVVIDPTCVEDTVDEIVDEVEGQVDDVVDTVGEVVEDPTEPIDDIVDDATGGGDDPVPSEDGGAGRDDGDGSAAGRDIGERGDRSVEPLSTEASSGAVTIAASVRGVRGTTHAEEATTGGLSVPTATGIALVVLLALLAGSIASQRVLEASDPKLSPDALASDRVQFE